MADNYLVSLAIHSAAIAGYYIALTPPARADKKETANAGPMGDTPLLTLLPRFFVHLTSPLEYLHFALELYGIYSSGTSQVITPSICPPKTSNLSGIYQSGQLPPAVLLGCLAMAAGGAIRLASYRGLGSMFRWEVSIQESHKLITSGIYSVVRHPSYTGNLIFSIGDIILLFARGTVLQECIVPAHGWVQVFIWALSFTRIAATIWLSWRSQEEDKLLKREFGKQWEAWAGRTRYRMIPLVY